MSLYVQVATATVYDTIAIIPLAQLRAASKAFLSKGPCDAVALQMHLQ